MSLLKRDMLYIIGKISGSGKVAELYCKQIEGHIGQFRGVQSPQMRVEVQYKTSSDSRYILLNYVGARPKKKLQLHHDGESAYANAVSLTYNNSQYQFYNKIIPSLHGSASAMTESLVAPVYYQLGVVCKLSNRYTQSAEYFSKAFQNDPSLWIAYEELCQLGYEDMAKQAWDSARINSQEYLIQQQMSPRQQIIQANNNSLTNSEEQRQKTKLNISQIKDHQENFLQQSQQYNQQLGKEGDQMQSDLQTPQLTNIQRQLNFSVGKTNQSTQIPSKYTDPKAAEVVQEKKRRNDNRARRAYDKSVSDQQQYNNNNNPVRRSQRIASQQNNSQQPVTQNSNQNLQNAIQSMPAQSTVQQQPWQQFQKYNSMGNQQSLASPTQKMQGSYGRGSRDNFIQQLDTVQQPWQRYRSQIQPPDFSRDSFSEAWHSPRSQSEKFSSHHQAHQQQAIMSSYDNIPLEHTQRQDSHQGNSQRNKSAQAPYNQGGNIQGGNSQAGQHSYRKQQSKNTRSIRSLVKSYNINGERNLHGEAKYINILSPAAEGIRYLHVYKCKEALECFEKLSFKQFSTSWAQCMLGRIYFEMYEYYSAVKMFETGRKIDSSRLQSMEVYSTVLWHLKRPVELSVLAQEALQLDRKSSYTWCIVGNCFSLQKEHESAIKCFNRSIQLDNNMTYAYTLCGHEYFANDDFEKAQQCFTQALAKNKRHINAWYGLGMIFYRQEKYDLAVNNFTVALQINPNSSILKCYLGMAQHKVGKLKEAQKYLDLSIQNDPRNCLSLYKKAGLLLEQGDLHGALKQLEQIKDLAPKEFAVYYQIGGIHKKLNRKDKALIMFTQALDLKPPQADQTAIKQAIEKLNNPDDDVDYLS